MEINEANDISKKIKQKIIKSKEPKFFQQVPMSQILIDDSININEISNEKSKNFRVAIRSHKPD